MRKVLILQPRLDVMFKKGPVPMERGPVIPIRVYWQKFVDAVKLEHLQRGDIVRAVELPNWQFSPDLVDMYKADLTYIPHKEKHNFDCGDANVLYYMQMVIPHLFMVDPQGWCAGASNWPIAPSKGKVNRIAVNTLRARIDSNESKFDQPKQTGAFPKGYIFFPCQIPHDETIKYHSDVSVADALLETIDFASGAGLNVIVKGHPVNRASCEPLRKITEKYSKVAHWVDDVSVHDLLSGCEAVFTINSGVGVEAILHNKPVFVFGRADYNDVAFNIKIDPESLQSADRTWPDRYKRIIYYDRWLDAYIKTCYDCNISNDFIKLPGE